MDAFQQAREYLARALPWPQANEEPSFVNIHWTFVPKDGNVRRDGAGKELLPWAGRAVQSVNEAIKAIDWAMKKEDTRDIYVCLSTQRQAEAKKSAKGFGYNKPIRNQSNAVALKSLFLDIDVKGGENGYSCMDEAVGALSIFVREVGLPLPSMLVQSGGGLHVYWTFSRALIPAEWQPLANALAEATKKHGLKCDTQVTIDSARVLRVPNTFNRKTEPPRPVVLACPGRGHDYLIERLAEPLKPYNTIEPSPLPPRPAIQGVSDLAAGIDSNKSAPINLDSVLPECAFLRDAVTSGGKDYLNPLWNLTTLISTFTEGGIADAHRMGNQHPGYSKENTDEFYARKERERDEKGLGWPSCKTISASGCKACQACPHLAAGKSPLRFGLAKVQPAAPAASAVVSLLPGATPIPPGLGDMPDGFTRLADGRIAALVEMADGSTHPQPICEYKMVDPWLQEDAKDGLILHFTTSMGLGVNKKISLQARIVSTQEMVPALQTYGLMVPVGPKARETIARFMVNWIRKLQDTREAILTAPFGWNVKKATGILEGFIYGGSMWTPAGPKVAGNADPVLQRNYTPCGDIQKWRDAAAMITAQGRPALETIVASAFAAPLVRFTGREGAVISAYSSETGIGKTTAARIAQAVWGDPVRASQTLDDTHNAVMGKLGQLRSLPLYWDELKTEDEVKKFVKLVFQVAQGKEKSRMTRNIEQREPGSWQTLVVACSNDSLIETVNNSVNTSEAGLVRVFEFIVPPPDENTPGQLADADASRMLAALNDNYGHIGQLYAEWLGKNSDAIDREMSTFLRDLGQEVSAKQDERYWIATMGTILMGARYANQLGFTNFDEAALKDFMLFVLGELRQRRASSSINLNEGINISTLLQQFFGAMRGRHTLRTNRIHVGAGKPPVGSIKTVGPTDRIESVQVQIGMDDKIVRLSNFKFKEWLKEKGYARQPVMEALKKMGAKQVNGRLAGGVPNFVGGTEYLWEIDLAGTPLLDFIDEA